MFFLVLKKAFGNIEDSFPSVIFGMALSLCRSSGWPLNRFHIISSDCYARTFFFLLRRVFITFRKKIHSLSVNKNDHDVVRCVCFKLFFCGRKFYNTYLLKSKENNNAKQKKMPSHLIILARVWCTLRQQIDRQTDSNTIWRLLLDNFHNFFLWRCVKEEKNPREIERVKRE